MKNILIISAVFPPEQVTSAFLNYDLAKALAKDYRVSVLRPKPTRPIGATFQDGWSDPDFETILIDSYTHPESELIGRFKEARDFSKKSVEYLKAHRDEIDFVYNDGWQLFGLYIIARACVKYNIPYIVPIQDIYPECLLTKSHIPGFAKKIIEGDKKLVLIAGPSSSGKTTFSNRLSIQLMAYGIHPHPERYETTHEIGDARKLEDGTYEPRIKKSTDQDWNAFGRPVRNPGEGRYRRNGGCL